MLIFSFDRESNGLHGETLAIAATVRRDGREIDRFLGRTPDPEVPLDQWITDNILPAIAHLEITHQTDVELEDAFWEFWLPWREQEAIPLAHCHWPVETRLFHRMVDRDQKARGWLGPYPNIEDVASPLRLLEESIDSTDAYLARHELEVPYDGIPHDPMFDSVSAAVVYEHAVGRIKRALRQVEG